MHAGSSSTVRSRSCSPAGRPMVARPEAATRDVLPLLTRSIEVWYARTRRDVEISSNAESRHGTEYARLPFAHHVPRAAGVLICKRVLVAGQIRAPTAKLRLCLRKFSLGWKARNALQGDSKASLGQIRLRVQRAHLWRIREPQISRRFMDPTPLALARKGEESVCLAAEDPLSTTHSTAAPHASASQDSSRLFLTSSRGQPLRRRL